MAAKPELIVEKLLIVGGISDGLFGAWLGVSSGYAIAEFVGVRHFEQTLELEQQTSLASGRYTYVVRELEPGGKLELTLVPEQ